MAAWPGRIAAESGERFPGSGAPGNRHVNSRLRKAMHGDQESHLRLLRRIGPCAHKAPGPHCPPISGGAPLGVQIRIEAFDACQRIVAAQHVVPGNHEILIAENQRQVEPGPQRRGACDKAPLGDFVWTQTGLVANYPAAPDSTGIWLAGEMDQHVVLHLERQRESPQRSRCCVGCDRFGGRTQCPHAFEQAVLGPGGLAHSVAWRLEIQSPGTPPRQSRFTSLAYGQRPFMMPFASSGRISPGYSGPKWRIVGPAGSTNLR